MTTSLLHGSRACGCDGRNHATRLVAVTGGPGAGKTAVLEMAARSFCRHVLILPEAATVLFGGGFHRLPGASARRPVQRAIFSCAAGTRTPGLEDGNYAMILCDRGTLDGAVYWPGEPEGLWNELGVDKNGTGTLLRGAAPRHSH